MFGAGAGQPTEEQRKAQEQYAYDTLKTAGAIAGLLWITPIVYHYIKKQF
jgi:mitochondrial import receptor subunit TOM5